MKFGVLGTGNVGATLGSAFIALGHEVRMGARDANNEKAAAWAASQGKAASSGTFADAVAFGDIIVLATLGEANESALRMAGVENFAGKVLIDTTNPLDFSKGFPPNLFLGRDDSGGEAVQRVVPEARVVKAFNSVGAPHMFRPDLPGGPPTMFIAGDDAAAKATVGALLTQMGWESLDTGGIVASRFLEPLCLLWVGYGARTGTWNHAFKLLRK